MGCKFYDSGYCRNALVVFPQLGAEAVSVSPGVCGHCSFAVEGEVDKGLPPLKPIQKKGCGCSRDRGNNEDQKDSGSSRNSSRARGLSRAR